MATNLISTKHKLYLRKKFGWMAVRDAIEGVDAVKNANELYLPMPQGFLDDDTSASTTSTGSSRNNRNKEIILDAPYYHENPAYMSYLHRARFPEITVHTLRGLIGIATRNKPEIELPSKISYLEENATNKGESLEDLFAICLAGVLSQGRITLVVDVKKDNTLCIVPYQSNVFTNWIDDEMDGSTKVAVFEESFDIQKGENQFETEEQTLSLTYSYQKSTEHSEQEVVTVIKYVDGNAQNPIVPSLQGKLFDEIPVVTIGSLVNQNDPNPAPLQGVAEIAYAIYRKDADLSQAQYMTCNPMFVITGAENDSGVPVTYGSTAALILSRAEAQAFFPATDTSALDHVSESIEKLFEEAANYGAALLGPTKKAAEATETVKMRQGAQGATLVGVVNNVSLGITKALQICAQIVGANPEDAQFKMTTDFAERSLTPQMLTALVQAWQNGAYSLESLLKVMKESGLTPHGEDIEDELTRIDNEGPTEMDEENESEEEEAED